MMQGQIIWDALDTISAYLGVNDVELFIDSLLSVREFQAKTSK
jgi:hypothetical protein